VAAALAGDDRHHEYVELFTGLRLANRPLLVPGTVALEVGYLLNREAGARVEALFLTALADGDFTPQVTDFRSACRRTYIWCQAQTASSSTWSWRMPAGRTL
jgi:hypothetical protein